MRGPGRRGANQTVALPAQAELFRRRPERIHHGNVAELAPRLEILAQQVSAVLGFSRSDDQAVPVRNARLVHPIPRAVGVVSAAGTIRPAQYGPPALSIQYHARWSVPKPKPAGFHKV